jgi:pimeloyl-ACP methyl ester carboxylesterase
MAYSLARLLILGIAVTATGHAAVDTPSRDPSKHKVQFVTVEDGVRVEVLDWGGSGRPIVLLAGLGMTAHVFDDFGEKLAQWFHVYGITRRGYGASSHPASGYSEQRRAEDDLKVIETLKLAAPVVMGHSIAGNELTQLGTHFPGRIAGLIYLDALSDGSDDYTDYDAVCRKLPEAMQKPPVPSASDSKNFRAYREWRVRTGGVSIPEAELRTEFAENPDGSVGAYKIPGTVPEAIMSGDHKHDYSQIRTPVLALVGFPETPQEQTRKKNVTNASQKIMVAAVYGTYVGMTRHRIERISSALGGARVVELWGADHFVFLSNEADVLRETRAFLATLH